MCGLPFAPESPWWLVRRGRIEDARSVIVRLSGSTIDADLHVQQIKETIELEERHAANTSYLDTVRGANRRRTNIALMVFVLQQVAGVVFVLGFSSYFFQLAGFDTSNSFRLGVGVTGIGIIGNLVALFTVNAFGRRALFFWGMIWAVHGPRIASPVWETGDQRRSQVPALQNDPLVDRPVLSFGYVEPSPGGADETETSEDEAYFALEIRFVGIDKVPEMQKSTKDQNSYCRQDLRDDDICDHAAHGVDADPDTHGLRPELGRPDLCKDDIAQRSDTSACSSCAALVRAEVACPGSKFFSLSECTEGPVDSSWWEPILASASLWTPARDVILCED